MNKTVNKFLLIIVETRKGANTDDIYIKETIKRFYPDIHNIIPKFIYMESKGAFKSSKLNHDIKEYVSYSNVVGIIQCIDLDNYDTSVTDKNLNDRIELHCKKKNYDFVWFCKNIEDVFYFNTSIEKNKKVIKAKQFIQNNMIKNIDECYLKSKIYSKRYSNILNVLDKYYKNNK